MKVAENIDVIWHHDIQKKETVCMLMVNGNDEYVGKSKCGHGDAYNKIIGRKISLKRAIEKAMLPKGIRAHIWEAIKAKGIKLVAA